MRPNRAIATVLVGTQSQLGPKCSRKAKNSSEVLVRKLNFVFVFLGGLVFLIMLSTAQIKIEAQGGNVTQPRHASSPQPSKKLTNQDAEPPS